MYQIKPNSSFSVSGGGQAMFIGKPKKLYALNSNQVDNKITTFIKDLMVHISINLNQRDIKAESRLIERLLKESLEDLPPTTVFTAI